MRPAAHTNLGRPDEALPCGRMRRLSPALYQGHAFVHWNMTSQDRWTGWLTPSFHQHFREVQLHTLSRYKLLCLCYCLMPDHLHLLWAGLSEESDQDKAACFFRKHINRIMASEAGAGSGSAPGPACGAERLPVPASSAGAGSGSAPKRDSAAVSLTAPALQKQAWDVVLRERDRERGAIERQLFYIAENPVRGRLVADARDWAFSGCQAAGYPDLDWRDVDFAGRLWKIYETEVRTYGAARLTAPAPAGAGSGSAPGPAMTDDRGTP